MRQLLPCPLGLGSGQQRTTVPGQAILGPAHIESEEAGGTSQGPTANPAPSIPARGALQEGHPAGRPGSPPGARVVPPSGAQPSASFTQTDLLPASALPLLAAQPRTTSLPLVSKHDRPSSLHLVTQPSIPVAVSTRRMLKTMSPDNGVYMASDCFLGFPKPPTG
ncbi:hypothetical protein R6Z07F_017069 [Ovis aries]